MNQRLPKMVLFCTSLLLVGCSDQTTEPQPAGLVVAKAPSTVGAPGWELIDTLAVRAVDPSGTPRAGVAVAWSIRQGGGGIAPLDSATDANGYARAVWTLGSAAGVNQARASTLEGAAVDFESMGQAYRSDLLAGNGSMGCGVANNELRCWGLSFWANAPPVSNNLDFGWFNASPGLVDDSRSYAELAVSYSNNPSGAVCALDSTGTAWCSNGSQAVMVGVSGLPAVHRMVAASIRPGFCALAVSDSTAWCWQFGGAPAQPPGSPAFTALAMEGNYTNSQYVYRICGLLADSTAACWGPGPLGGGTTDSSDSPVPVAGGHRFVQVAVGGKFSCGLESGGEVWCWGKAASGPDVLVPTLVASAVSAIAAHEEYGFLLDASGVRRGNGAGLAGLSPVFGLGGLAVERFVDTHADCLQLADGEAYCQEDMFNNSSGIYDKNYSPIQPVRVAPASVTRRQGAR